MFVFITITKVKEENLNQQKTDSELEWQPALEKDRKLKEIQATGGEEIYGSKYSKLERNMKENQMGPN